MEPVIFEDAMSRVKADVTRKNGMMSYSGTPLVGRPTMETRNQRTNDYDILDYTNPAISAGGT
jgi:hypothetical protein